VVFIGVLAYPAHLRVVGGYATETDFYGRYAPDADRILTGRFPQSTFNPPGYPTLLALVSPLVPDHFTAGKWLSLIAAAAAGLVAFQLFRQLFDARVALLALPIFLLSGALTKFALTATTDVPFLLVAVTTAAVLFREQSRPWVQTVLGGILTGVAYLIRYNGVFLIPPGIAAVSVLPGHNGARARLTRVALYLGVLLVTVSPWFWLSYAHYGSPIYSTNYRNTAIVYYGSPEGFYSMRDVIARAPARFAVMYVRRLGENIGRSLGASLAVLPVAPLAAVGIVAAVARRRRRSVLLLLGSLFTLFLVLTLTHWDTRYYFYAIICYAGFTAYAIVTLVDWLRVRFRLSAVVLRLIFALLVLVILVPSVGRSYERVKSAVTGQAADALAASVHLRKIAGPGARVMSFKPHVAYLAGVDWMRLPVVGSVDELHAVVRQAAASFFVYENAGMKSVPALYSLAHPEMAPAWLAPAYVDSVGHLVIYAVRRDR
jgi:hypothetical protein